MVHIEFFEEEGIIQIIREGELTASDMVDFINKIDDKYNHLENLFILDRIGESKSEFTNIDQLQTITDEISERISNYKFVKAAILVEVPFETAMVYMFQQIVNKIPNYRVEVFSTESAAKRWLKSG